MIMSPWSSPQSSPQSKFRKDPVLGVVEVYVGTLTMSFPTNLTCGMALVNYSVLPLH